MPIASAPAGESQWAGLAGFARAAAASLWLEYKTLRLYPANLWLRATQELTTIGVWYFLGLFVSPVANGTVAGYGGNYVAYVLVGVLLNQIGLVALRSPFTTLSEAFWDKRLETYRLAVSGIWANLVGRLAWQVLFSSGLQALALTILVGTGTIPLAHGLSVVAVLMGWPLLVLANAGLGLMGASLFFLLEVKNGQDPITWVYQYLVQLVSGLYVPLTVLPGWLRDMGRALPQTYAFAAMRFGILEGRTGPAVMSDLAILAIEGTLLLSAGIVMVNWGLRRAERRSGLGVVV